MTKLKQEDLGELFFIELEGDRWSSAIERQISKLRPGGIILTARNMSAPDSTLELLGNISRTLDFRPFLAIDEEGGAADPLCSFLPKMPPPLAVGRRGPEAASWMGELIGAAMSALGFNTNFAPSLDVHGPSDAGGITAQCFGPNQEVVTRCGALFIQGLKRNGILACGKYFPGTGEARCDGETGFYLSGKPMARIWREDLAPYLNLLPQLSMVMVSHRGYKAYDFDCAVPAFVSESVLNGLLRVKLGYRGIALVDTSDETGKPRYAESPNPEAASRSFGAGIDMVVVRGGEKAFTSASESLKSAIETGTVSGQQIAESLKRIRGARKNLSSSPKTLWRKSFEKLSKEFEDFSREFSK